MFIGVDSLYVALGIDIFFNLFVEAVPKRDCNPTLISVSGKIL